MILCDVHTHSLHSFDAESSVDEMCRTAIERDLTYLAVTDHCEAEYICCGEDCEFGSFDRLIPQSIRDIHEAQRAFDGRLQVLCGLELGEPMHDLEQTKKALAYGDFDFVLASVHNLRGRDDFYFMDFKQVNVNEILREYFDELAETAAFPYFDSLSHLTYPLRYIAEREGYYPDLLPFEEQIDRIFNILIKNQKALEINVSGLFKPINRTLPDANLVKKFHDMGGRYITLGTDAHCAVMVGKGIKEGIKVAKQAGFTHYTVFEKHQPKLIPFE